jgi:hypothetical protein
MKSKTTFTKQKVSLVLIFVLLLLIPLTMFSVVTTNKYLTPPLLNQQMQKNVPLLQPTASPSSESSPSVSPQNKLLDLIQNRRPLSQADSQAKAHILSLLPTGEDSGILYQNADITIEYNQSPDLFQVAIATNNIANAKSEASLWFQQHGVSQVGICDFPVSFYLNPQVMNIYRSQNRTFNPLPVGC